MYPRQRRANTTLDPLFGQDRISLQSQNLLNTSSTRFLTRSLDGKYDFCTNLACEIKMGQKYREEIEEILEQAGDLRSSSNVNSQRKKALATRAWHTIRWSLNGSLLSLNPGRVLLIGLSFLLASFVLNLTTPGFGLIGILGWSGFILFIAGYAMFFIRPKSVEKRWRGEVIEIREESWISKISRRFK